MVYDTLIIGGGIGGLQAAIQLGRCLRNVLVVDRGDGRSSLARKYRNILGYPDGIGGPELRSLGREQAIRFGVQFQTGEVITVERQAENLFQAEITEGRSVLARTLLFATGIEDPLPDIPGMSPCLGESLFICPDCDGYEVTDRHAIIIGEGQTAEEMAQALSHFTQQLTMLGATAKAVGKTGEKTDSQRETVAEIIHDQGRMTAVITSRGRKIEVEKGFLAFPGAKVNTSLLCSLGVTCMPNGHVQVNPRTMETDCPNVWSVGDIVAHSQQVTIAMGDGSQAAIWIHKRLNGQVPK